MTESNTSLFTRMTNFLLGEQRRAPEGRRAEREIHTWTPTYKEDPL